MRKTQNCEKPEKANFCTRLGVIGTSSKLNKFPFGLVTLMEIGSVNTERCLDMYGEGGGVIFFLSSFGGVKLLFPSESSMICFILALDFLSEMIY